MKNNVQKKCLTFFATTLFLAIGSLSSANASACGGGLSGNDFIGTWLNDDAHTNNITRIKVTCGTDANGHEELKMQVWGRCGNSECDWGIVPAQDNTHIYSRISATYYRSWATTYIWGTIWNYYPKRQATFHSFTDFTDPRRADIDWSGEFTLQ